MVRHAAVALVCLALAHAISSPNLPEALVDGEIARGQHGNSFDGGPCTSAQTRCSDGACCLTGSWLCEPEFMNYQIRDGRDGRFCWQTRDPPPGPWRWPFHHLQKCDPENARSALCDGGKANVSFLEGVGFPGQNCDDRRWLHAFLSDASECPVGPSQSDDDVCPEMASLLHKPPTEWDQQVRRTYAASLRDSTYLKAFDEICADRGFCAANGFGPGDARAFRPDSFKWLARHGDRARRCHAELLRGAPTEAWGRCCCKVVARIGPEWELVIFHISRNYPPRHDWELLKVPGWEVTYRNKPKACKAAADAAGSGARPPGSLVDAHIGRQHKHNNGKKDDKDDDDDRFTTNLEYERHCFLSDGSFFRDGRCRLKRYRLFKKSLRKRNLWPKMSSQEVAAYVAVAVAAAGAIVHVLRGRRGKTYSVDDKYP